MNTLNRARVPFRRLTAALLLSSLLGACTPLVVGSVGTGVMLATDRRTSGTQVEDQRIELAAQVRMRELFEGRSRVDVTSYNRRVLLTGQVRNESDRSQALKALRAIENVKEVVDELSLGEPVSASAMAADAVTTARVKAAFLDAIGLDARSIKVVTEQGTVYLMGRVTLHESQWASEIARTVTGVKRVVRVFETLSEAELRSLRATQ